VKFKTSDLIARIDNLLRDLEGKAIDRAEKLDDEREGARDAWLEDHAVGFREFAFRINGCLNSGRPVTIGDIPQGIKGRSNTDLKFYFEPAKNRPLVEDRKHESLLKLKAALQASTDETTSPTAIKQLGFQDVTFLFAPEAAA
jgi:hypothetical protein